MLEPTSPIEFKPSSEGFFFAFREAKISFFRLYVRRWERHKLKMLKNFNKKSFNLRGDFKKSTVR